MDWWPSPNMDNLPESSPWLTHYGFDLKLGALKSHGVSCFPIHVARCGYTMVYLFGHARNHIKLVVQLCMCICIYIYIMYIYYIYTHYICINIYMYIYIYVYICIYIYYWTPVYPSIPIYHRISIYLAMWRPGLIGCRASLTWWHSQCPNSGDLTTL
jgi:hypothetical protein